MNPLLSQPIVELCLSIPSWYWINGGRDRAVARRAFARQIPKALLDRRSKGGPDTFATEVLERDRLKIHALLREGILPEKGIVDVNAVDQALAGRTPVQATEFLRLSLLTEAEVWCRHWS
jgi:asparagine synthase (glutamine-hydrolysing)